MYLNSEYSPICDTNILCVVAFSPSSFHLTSLINNIFLNLSALKPQVSLGSDSTKYLDKGFYEIGDKNHS